MGIPQVILIVITGIGIGGSLSKHGKEQTAKVNWWITLLSATILHGLLFWGGFYG